MRIYPRGKASDRRVPNRPTFNSLNEIPENATVTYFPSQFDRMLPAHNFDDGLSSRDDLSQPSSNGSTQISAIAAPVVISENSVKSIFPRLEESCASQLLLESLIYDLCQMQEKDPEKCKCLFQNICGVLEQIGFVKGSYKMDSFHKNRVFLSSALKNFIRHKVANATHRSLPPCGGVSLLNESKILNADTFHAPIEPNRYSTEFTDKHLIERGGFGTVYRARHNLDNHEYAIKAITFRFKRVQDYQKIIREVQLYARLPAHPHVVCYKTAWMESEIICRTSPKKDLELRKTESPNDDSSSIQFQENVSDQIKLVKNSNVTVMGVKQVNKTTETTISGDERKESRRSDSAIKGYESESSTSGSVLDNGVVKPNGGCSFNKMQYKATLYIQMELCGINLRKWINERNQEFFNHNNGLQVLNQERYKEALAIFRQILKGVEFLHSNRLIHRDLKPQNIFFNLLRDQEKVENKVKIGDFGLATLHTQGVEVEPNSATPTPRTSFSSTASLDVSGENHTIGMGTKIYVAPEQRKTATYDVKADMYSLGIILFEMLHPFGPTLNEKQRSFDLLKKQSRLPASFEKEYPEATKVILSLIERNHRLRPSASEVLSSPIFPSKDQRRIMELEEEVLRLKERNKYLESMLNQRTEQL